MASIDACTRVLREVAEQIGAGKFGSSTEAMTFLLDRIDQAMEPIYRVFTQMSTVKKVTKC